MKKTFETPEIEIIMITAEDVITSSKEQGPSINIGGNNEGYTGRY